MQILKTKKLKNALVRIVESSFNAKEIQQKELEISSYLNENIDELPMNMRILLMCY